MIFSIVANQFRHQHFSIIIKPLVRLCMKSLRVRSLIQEFQPQTIINFVQKSSNEPF